jgi:ribosome-binding ATPase YchF (GTP1/OBG family)
LQLKDLENVEKRLEKVKRAAKTGNKEAIVEETLLNRIRETLHNKIRTITPQNNDESFDGRFSVDYSKTSIIRL